MGGADGVDVQFFHQIEVSPDILKAHDMTFDRIGVMMVHTFQLYGNAIDQKLTFWRDSNGTKAYRHRNVFTESLPVPVCRGSGPPHSRLLHRER